MENIEKSNKETLHSVKTRTIEYEHAVVDSSCMCDAYYSSRNNSFTINHKNNDPEFNKRSHSEHIACHEMKHKDNYQQGMNAYALSPEQAYKVEMHNEISANIAELLALREEYLKTGNIDVFDIEPQFKFYKKAIQSGEINPHSQYKEDFDKEMSLIANGTRDMWEQKFAKHPVYIEQCAVNGAYYCETSGKRAKYYNQNYERAKKVVYSNIGGVDFTKYMNGDVKIPAEGKKLLNQNVNQARRYGRKSVYEAHIGIIRDDYFEREDDNNMEKAANRPVKNDPINPINKKPPRYKPGAKIERKQILDMRSNVIQQPTMSRGVVFDRMRQDHGNAANKIRELLAPNRQNNGRRQNRRSNNNRSNNNNRTNEDIMRNIIRRRGNINFN